MINSLLRSCCFLLVSSLLYSLFGCERAINLNITDEKKLVVLSNFAPNQQLDVKLSWTQTLNTPISNVQSPADATIRLFENGVFLENLVYTDNEEDFPFYISSTHPIPEKAYSIEIEVPGFAVAKSANTVPIAIPIAGIEDVEVDSSSAVFPELTTYFVDGSLQLPPSSAETQYLHIVAYRNGFEEQFINGAFVIVPFRTYLNFTLPNNVAAFSINHEPGFLITAQDFPNDGLNFSTNFEANTTIENPSSIIIEVRNCSPEYYHFHKAMGDQEASNDAQRLLSTQQVFIPNNIEAGVGNFSGYNSTIDSITW